MLHIVTDSTSDISSEYQKKLNINEFIERLKKDDYFCKEYGNLGPVYGKQWRNFNGVDQIKNIVNDIRNIKYSRRLIVSS